MADNFRDNRRSWKKVDSRYIVKGEDSEREYYAPIESPIRITIASRESELDIGLFMRTPGADRELVTGLLYNEGIIDDYNTITNILMESGSIRVSLRNLSGYSQSSHRRSSLVTGSCGVCGRGDLHDHKSIQSEYKIERREILNLHKRANENQSTYMTTGGTHGVSAFDGEGNLIATMEDVGRHNAMDKVTGVMIALNVVPEVCILSGRVSYELVQKAIRTGYSVVSAVGSASTMAIQVAREHDLTLISFARDDRMTILSSPRRIV